MVNRDLDVFDGNVRHLTTEQWFRLRRSIVAQAHEEQRQAVRAVLVAVSRLARNAWQGWRRLRARQEARSELSLMTDCELRDISISRTGIEAAIQHRADGV